jgi:hypothetical protein
MYHLLLVLAKVRAQLALVGIVDKMFTQAANDPSYHPCRKMHRSLVLVFLLTWFQAAFQFPSLGIAYNAEDRVFRSVLGPTSHRLTAILQGHHDRVDNLTPFS